MYLSRYSTNFVLMSCTTIAVKEAICVCGREREDLVGMELMLIAYDKDLNGNIY